MKRKFLKIYLFVFGVIVYFASLYGMVQLFNAFSEDMQKILFVIYFVIHTASFVVGGNHLYQSAYSKGYNNAKKGELDE